MFGEKEKVRIYLGSDHAGFESGGIKAQLKEYLDGEGYAVTDLGSFSPEACDYPDIAREVAEKVSEVPGAFGILICGSGVGMEIAANKVKGIRAVVVSDEALAETSRVHNDANVLTMGSRLTDLETMKKIANKFLTTEFESGEERRVRRVEKLNAM